MKRPLPLAPLSLFLINLGVVSCGSKPPGRTACAIDEVCLDGGFDINTDTAALCFDTLGYVVACANHDASTSEDSPIIDAGADAAITCVFDAVYVYGRLGEAQPYTDQVTLTPPFSYVLVQTTNPVGGGSYDGACNPPLPSCGSALI